MVKFLRRTSNRYSKLGKGRKKKQVWRRPTGRDNKMRERRKGYPARVEVGYKTEKKNQKKFIVINNVSELEKIKKDVQIIIGNVGKKKKIEIGKIAKEKKIKIQNLNVGKFLKEIDKKKKTGSSKIDQTKEKKESGKTDKKKIENKTTEKKK